MNILIKLFLWLHMIGGGTALITGTVNLMRRKGDKIHRLWGNVFFISMLVTGISALTLAVFNPNYFLFIIGIFTLYQVIAGKRYLRYKKVTTNKIERFDIIVITFMSLAALVFFGMSIRSFLNSNLFGWVLFTFGGIGILFVMQDLKHLGKKSSIKNFWLIAHLQRMIGAYISALTAFLVVNAKHFPKIFPGWVYWLLPTLILTPLIVKWSGMYTVRRTESRSNDINSPSA